MTPEGHNELIPLLQQQLQASDRPLTSAELYDIPEIRAVAPSANRISDYLGVMFRRGEVNRVQARGVGGSRARWAYVWREKVTPEWKRRTGAEPRPFRPKTLLDRPNLSITEDGTHLHLDMPELSITIEIRKK